MELSTDQRRDQLHQYLWDNSDHEHRIKVCVKHLAEERNVDYFAIYYLIDALRKANRIRRVARGNYTVCTYVITDPATYDAASPPPKRPLCWE